MWVMYMVVTVQLRLVLSGCCCFVGQNCRTVQDCWQGDVGPRMWLSDHRAGRKVGLRV